MKIILILGVTVEVRIAIWEYIDKRKKESRPGSK